MLKNTAGEVHKVPFYTLSSIKELSDVMSDKINNYITTEQLQQEEMNQLQSQLRSMTVQFGAMDLLFSNFLAQEKQQLESLFSSTEVSTTFDYNHRSTMNRQLTAAIGNELQPFEGKLVHSNSDLYSTTTWRFFISAVARTRRAAFISASFKMSPKRLFRLWPQYDFSETFSRLWNCWIFLILCFESFWIRIFWIFQIFPNLSEIFKIEQSRMMENNFRLTQPSRSRNISTLHDYLMVFDDLIDKSSNKD